MKYGWTTVRGIYAWGVRDGKCLRWPGGHDKDGYGVVQFGGRQWRVHRLVYMVYVAEVPDDHDVHHRCGTKDCFRPRHLHALPKPQHNRIEALARPKQEQCKHGHSLADAYVYRSKRYCRACNRLSALARYYRRLGREIPAQ